MSELAFLEKLREIERGADAHIDLVLFIGDVDLDIVVLGQDPCHEDRALALVS